MSSTCWPSLLRPRPSLPAPRAAQPQFWRIEGARDFLEGDDRGALRRLRGPRAPGPRHARAPRPRGAVRLVRWPATARARSTPAPATTARSSGSRAARRTLFFDAPELEVHALAVGPDGRALRRHLARRQGVRGRRGGQGGDLLRPRRQVHLGPRLRQQRATCCVATGAEGRVYRVDRQGKAEIVLTSAETHITALAVDAAAASTRAARPAASSTASTPRGKVFVLHDSPYREVKALRVGRTAASTPPSIDGKRRTTIPSRPRRRPCHRARRRPVPGARGHGHGELRGACRPARTAAARAAAAPADTRARARQGRACCACCRRARWTRSGPRPRRRRTRSPPPPTACWWAPATRASSTACGTTAPGPWSPPSPPSRSRALHRADGGRDRARHLQPGQAHVAQGGAGERGTFTSKVQGHRDGLELGPPALGGERAAGQRRSRCRPAAATRHARPHLVRLVAALPAAGGRRRSPARRARFLQVKATLNGKDGRDARARLRHRRLPAAQPAAAGADDHRPSRRARCSRSRSR